MIVPGATALSQAPAHCEPPDPGQRRTHRHGLSPTASSICHVPTRGLGKPAETPASYFLLTLMGTGWVISLKSPSPVVTWADSSLPAPSLF